MRLVRSFLLLAVICGLAELALSSEPNDNADPQCPALCRCETTKEGLHKALCFNFQELYKYSLKNQHHNINILDLSYCHIKKVNTELDRFTEMVSLDLSNNDIEKVTKFLSNSRKLVHLNLAKNQLNEFSASALPKSVSSLDLRNNRLKNVPTDLSKLKDLEHLMLEGNPLDCTCENLNILNGLQKSKILLDNVRCAYPKSEGGNIWHKSNIFKNCKKSVNEKEMMLGDEPEHETIAPLESSQKSMEMVTSNDADHSADDRDLLADNSEFLFPSKDYTEKPTEESKFDGSGDDDIGNRISEIISEDPTSSYTTELPIYEGSSFYDGSGDEELIEVTSTTTDDPLLAIPTFGEDGNYSYSNEAKYHTIPPKSLFPDIPDWQKSSTEATILLKKETYRLDAENKATTNKETTTATSESSDAPLVEQSKSTQKTSVGTYVCIGLIIAFLVGLILITVIKGQLRKRRDRRHIRHHLADVEKAGKEMVDMNKSLLGKPAPNNFGKKANGNYELVPTHDKSKKPENGTYEKKDNEDSPSAINSHDGASAPNGKPNTSNTDSHAPRYEDQPVINLKPLKSEYEPPHSNGYPEHDSLPYSNDHQPIIPDSGRVKIKLTETLKPKTPVLVTRSRSNAGDIIITPAEDQSPVHKNPTT